MRSYRSRMGNRGFAGRLAIGLAVGLAAASSAGAQTVSLAVANADFEAPVLQPGGFTVAVPPGWSLASGAGSNTGVFYPTVASWQYEAPSGHQLLYLNGASVEQQLTTNAEEGKTYLLGVDVVRRPGYWNPSYRIDFFAGTTLLGTDFASLVPEVGFSKVSLIQYTVGPGDPAIGQPLRVRLAGPTQTNFDNVRIFVPEPGPPAGLVGAIALAVLASRGPRPWRRG